MDTDVLVQATQFGIAGLIAWMWMTERRAALGRETQLSEAHDRLMEQRAQLDALVRLIAENTRALAALEAGLAALQRIIERIAAPNRTAHRDSPDTRDPSSPG
jgi:hypothetical protein